MGLEISARLEGLDQVLELLDEVRALRTLLSGGLPLKMVYTAREWAERTSYPESFIKQECREGRFPGAYQDLGKNRWFIPHEAGVRWLAARKAKAVPQR
ncbi:hypothetical protein [Meiothermus sp. Pnk-1]|uniref:hypothetical protein n=1 Tax=Meiothermus sp. Pnk-1 TaxID=873128 RepID=UPI000D7CFBF1|nr:hypothetical protein [Meiothermus sp. Pnk-1]PZA08265.1 hypothetical protein DNA98_03765 [Meiothermus sp. Pnk-1]